MGDPNLLKYDIKVGDNHIEEKAKIVNIKRRAVKLHKRNWRQRKNNTHKKDSGHNVK